MENLTFIVFVVLSCVTVAALMAITFAVLLEKQKNEIAHLKDANVCFVEKISRSEKWVSGLITALSKDVGNLSLTFEDARHKFEKGWELASKMAADIDNDFISIDPGRAEWLIRRYVRTVVGEITK